MEYFDYDFPISSVMVGSIIPGPRLDLPPARLTTFPDGTSYTVKSIRQTADYTIQRRRQQDPIVRYPSMHPEHTGKHGFLEKMKALMGMGKASPRMQEGYEPFAENRDWRGSTAHRPAT